jgi:DNA-binding PadR family transcriptional regulator
VVQVEERSPYPALQRILVKGWVTAEWSVSENNRSARYYSLTPEGREQFETEVSQFQQRLDHAIRAVPGEAEGVCPER